MLVWEGTTADTVEFIIAVPADPSTADTTVTFAETSGSVLLTDGTNTDDAILRSDGTGSLAQTSAVTIDDSDNVAGVTTLVVDGTYIALGSNPADAGTGIRMSKTLPMRVLVSG
jgi:hypothetical protein